MILGDQFIKDNEIKYMEFIPCDDKFIGLVVITTVDGTRIEIPCIRKDYLKAVRYINFFYG